MENLGLDDLKRIKVGRFCVVRIGFGSGRIDVVWIRVDGSVLEGLGLRARGFR